MGKRRVGVVPPGGKLDERDLVGGVAVDFIRAHVDKRALGAGPAGGLQEIERADGVGVEVVEGNCGGPVVRGLGRGVDDRGGLDRGDKPEHALAVADVEFMVCEGTQRCSEPALVPPRVAGGSEENGPLVVVEAVNPPSEGVEVGGDLAADEARGASNQDVRHIRTRRECKGVVLRERESGMPGGVCKKPRGNELERKFPRAHRKLILRWL